MKKTLHLAGIGMLIPIAACSGSVQSQDAATSPPASIDASADDTPCALDAGSAELGPIPALGPDFSDSSIAMLAVKGSGEPRYASRPQTMQVPGGEANIRLAYDTRPDGELRLTVCLASPEHGNAHSAPIGSQGGAHPVVAATFMANADAEPGEELIVLVSWRVENALGTSGTMFEPYVFKMPEGAPEMRRIGLMDPALSFGFDGVREGEQIRYPYQDASAFRARLQELGIQEQAR